MSRLVGKATNRLLTRRGLGWAALAVALGGCSTGHNVDVCPLGADLEQKLRAGSVQVASSSSSEVSIRGYDGQGALLATGTAPLGSGSSCVCLSAGTECHGVTCQWDGTICHFSVSVPDGGAPMGNGDGPSGPTVQTLRFGDNPGDDVMGVTTDTYISETTTPPPPHGMEPVFIADTSPGTVGLLRFDVTRIAPGAAVLAARLTLRVPTNDLDPTGMQRNSGTTDPVRMVRALESWDEASATWTARGAQLGNWMGAGCTGGSCDTVPALDIMPPLIDGTTYSWDLPPDLVQTWVSHPEGNFGLAIKLNVTTSGNNVIFLSHEGGTQFGERPRLEVQYRE